MQNKPSKWKQVFRWLPGVFISVVAVLAVLQFIDPKELKSAFSTVDLKFLLLIFAVDVLGLVVRGKAWQTILGKKVSYTQAFFGISEGYFLNNVLPFRAGELGRSYLVGRSSGLGTFYVLSTIVIERAFDIAFAGMLVVLTLPYLVGMEWIKPVASIALVLVIVGLFVLFMVARNKEMLLVWANRIQNPSKLVKFILPRIQSVIDGFSSLAKPSQFFLSLFWIGICWVVWLSVYYFAVSAIIPGAAWWWGGFVSGVLALGVAIPSAPSALGVFEATFVGAVAILGGSSASALAYAIILHFLHFVVSAIFGVWGLLREGLSFTQLFTSFTGNGINPKAIEAAKEGE
ncbi:MAG: Uncharacterized protein FD147_885 [Chloroflexi bacterium]|nr:MAG: Uncharacterized protein FD147_885 [Chloroflexota bacterium]